NADYPVGAKACLENARRPLLRELEERAAEMLGAHRIERADALQQFRREARNAGEADILTLRQRIADTQIAVVRDTDDIAGPGFLRQFPVLRKEQYGIVDIEGFLAPHMFQLRAAAEMAGDQPHKGNAVAVLGVHIGLDFKDKPADLLLQRRYFAACRG